MTRHPALTALALCLFAIAGCGNDTTRGTSDGGPGGGVDAGTAADSGGSSDGGASGDTYQVQFETSGGTFVVEVHRSWAPNGADRFRELVTSGFYDQCRFFRVVPGFMVQFGISGDPATSAMWSSRSIPDDPVMQSNTRAYVSYAQTAAPNSRTTQLFINFGDNSFLDAMRFAPFGIVTSGMEVVDAIDSEYGEMPMQSRIQSEGNTYLDASFPNLDYVVHATIL